jgi:hypothetical protein
VLRTSTGRLGGVGDSCTLDRTQHGRDLLGVRIAARGQDAARDAGCCALDVLARLDLNESALKKMTSGSD